MKPILAGAAAAALFAFAPAAASAQNNSIQGNVTAPAASTPPVGNTPPPVETEAPEPAAAPAPQAETAAPPPVTSETVVTTTEIPDIALPPVEEPVNPYANSYNELEPLMVEEDQGFDDWGLLGLLGLIGLLGLRRGRERVVYVERAETVRPVDQPPLR